MLLYRPRFQYWPWVVEVCDCCCWPNIMLAKEFWAGCCMGVWAMGVATDNAWMLICWAMFWLGIRMLLPSAVWIKVPEYQEKKVFQSPSLVYFFSKQTYNIIRFVHESSYRFYNHLEFFLHLKQNWKVRKFNKTNTCFKFNTRSWK